MWENVIKFLGGSALLLSAVAWLIRSILYHRLNKDVLVFKNNLERENAEYGHRVGLLNSKRADVIAELYRLLVEFVGAAQSYANPAEFVGEPSKDEKVKILGDCASNLKKYFVTHKIYFSKDLCDSIEKLLKKATDATWKYSFWRKYEDYGKKDAKSELDAWIGAWETMSEEVPDTLHAIEDDFRKLLGVN